MVRARLVAVALVWGVASGMCAAQSVSRGYSYWYGRQGGPGIYYGPGVLNAATGAYGRTGFSYGYQYGSTSGAVPAGPRVTPRDVSYRGGSSGNPAGQATRRGNPYGVTGPGRVTWWGVAEGYSSSPQTGLPWYQSPRNLNRRFDVSEPVDEQAVARFGRNQGRNIAGREVNALPASRLNPTLPKGPNVPGSTLAPVDARENVERKLKKLPEPAPNAAVVPDGTGKPVTSPVDAKPAQPKADTAIPAAAVKPAPIHSTESVKEDPKPPAPKGVNDKK